MRMVVLMTEGTERGRGREGKGGGRGREKEGGLERQIFLTIQSTCVSLGWRRQC